MFVFTVFLSGCSGVVTVEHIDISGFDSMYTPDKFNETYTDLLQDVGYFVKMTPSNEQRTGSYAIRINGEIYPFMLEAKKDSVFVNTTVRVCEDNHDRFFIQFGQSAVFVKNHNKMFKEEYTLMKQLLKENFPELEFKKRVIGPVM
jgi:hypothetical protein